VCARIAVRFIVLARSLIRLASWCVVGIFSPRLRRAAWSSCRGYLRVASGTGWSGA